MPTFKNLAQLETYLEVKLIEAMELTEHIIYEEIKQWIDLYYDEYKPKVYNRTGLMKDSFKYSGVKKGDDGYCFQVGYDDDYLEFEYPGNPNDPPSDINGIDGYLVLTSMNLGYHGCTVKIPKSHRHWDEALQDIEEKYGGITEIFKTSLKKVGLHVK